MTPARPRILIVDDEPQLLAVISSGLEILGYDCRRAEEAAEALRTLSREPIDLVLCDLHLGASLGTELLEEARRTIPGVPPFLMISGMDADALAGVSGAGIVGLVRKPFVLGALDEAIRAGLERTGA